MKRIIIITAAIISLTLGSCKLGHKYVKPSIDMPQSFAGNADTDSFNISGLKWWEIYSDTLLQNLIRKTLVHNKDLLISEARIKELAAMKRISVADLLPSIGGNAYMQNEGLDYGGNNYKNDPEIGLKLSVSWEIDLWGNLRWNKERSIAQLRGGIEAHRALQISLIAQVAQAYFELVALDHEYSIVTRTLQARREAVRIARLRYEGGLTAETSYLQAQTELARTATYLPSIQRNISLKENEISLLTGEYPNAIQRAAFTDDVELPSGVPVGLPSTMLQRRPDIRQAEQQLIAANAEMGMAYTNRFPRLTLTAQGGLESDEFKNFLKSPMHFLSAGLLGPVFDMGRRQAQYRAKQAAYEQACYRYENVVLGAFTDVRNALVTFNKVQDIYLAWKKLENSSKATMELAQLQYINGVVGYIDVLDAQRNYFDAQIGLSNALRNKRLCMVQLYKSLGGGW